MYDVVILGAGVTGCAVARELSRYHLNICVLEKEGDFCEGTSKANSGIVHSGFDAKPGTLKAKMNVRGNELMEQLSKQLDFPFRRNGSLLLCFDEKEKERLFEMKERGEKNNVPGLQILTKEELHQMEPNISKQAIGALYAPTGGIVCPFKLTMALGENAAENGVEFRFDTEVKEVKKTENGFLIICDGQEIETKTVVNAAGVYGDIFHNMVSAHKVRIIPRKGEYCLMDKSAGAMADKTIFQMPTALGKGVLVTPTVHGNLLIGPTARDIEDKEGIQTTAEGLRTILEKAGKSVSPIPTREIITSFAGLRAHLEQDDFMIEEAADSPGFVDVIGIESPGLTSAPAIGEYVRNIVSGILKPEKKTKWKAIRKDVISLEKMSFQERQEFVKENPAFGNIVCRCEKITEGEILSAIHRPYGAKTLDGIKRRTRAGMGRCQSGFCMPKVMRILERELSIPQMELTKAGGNSKILTGKNKENA